MAKKSRKKKYHEVRAAQRKAEGDLVGIELFCSEHPAYDDWAFHVLRFAANYNLHFEWQASRITRLYPVYSGGRSLFPAVGIEAVESFLEGYFSFLLHGFIGSCVDEFFPHSRGSDRPYHD
ncbi:hypothetical protein HOA55_05470 [archaeon]|jgi:hypothetical protein|nr:hypothetical protein [archaeon]MBT3577770.1 hypothetical protein [archaeon]MBT6820777.1 hypothetical protein [archaeon]MBT6956041.1 hypothetical protein [archaeon]MBT7025917.1 hypothetical protein [archaeon]